MKRNDSIELLRCVLMLGICILHSCSLGGYPNIRFICMLMPCVPCFIFISGYYGINTTPSRIVRFIVIAFASVPVAGIISWFAGYDILSGYKFVITGIVKNWFIWAYVALMCFTPMLNLAVESPEHKKLVLPIVVLSLGWGYVKGLPYFKMFMPTTEGLGSYTFTMMIGVYLVARLVRKYYKIFGKINIIYMIVAFIIISVLCIIGFGDYCSPISVIWSAILFVLFLRIKICDRLGKIVCFIAKSTFPIFVLHANKVGFDLIQRFAKLLCDGYGIKTIFMYIIVGFSVFVIGLLCDIPRRLIMIAMNNNMKANN